MRCFMLVLGLLCSMASPYWAGGPKEQSGAKKPDGLRFTFKAEGRLTLILDRETKAIKELRLADKPLSINLADDKKLHETMRELDGQPVIVTGVGTPFVIQPTGLLQGEKGIRLLITGIQAAKKD